MILLMAVRSAVTWFQSFWVTRDLIFGWGRLIMGDLNKMNRHTGKFTHYLTGT